MAQRERRLPVPTRRKAVSPAARPHVPARSRPQQRKQRLKALPARTNDARPPQRRVDGMRHHPVERSVVEPRVHHAPVRPRPWQWPKTRGVLVGRQTEVQAVGARSGQLRGAVMLVGRHQRQKRHQLALVAFCEPEESVHGLCKLRTRKKFAQGRQDFVFVHALTVSEAGEERPEPRLERSFNWKRDAPFAEAVLLRATVINTLRECPLTLPPLCGSLPLPQGARDKSIDPSRVVGEGPCEARG